MASNLLQGVLKHSAHERLDALIHDKDDSEDELVNVVRSFHTTPARPSTSQDA
jgi:hypothetical protein